LPEHDEEVTALPEHDEEVTALPEHDEEVTALPEHDEEVNALPVQDEDVDALPVHDEDVNALPVHDEDVNALPVQDEDVNALPVQDEEVAALPVKPPEKLDAVTDVRPLKAPDELSAISSVYASPVVLLPNDKPPPPLPYWLMKYDFPLEPSRFQVSQVPCTFVADDDVTISALFTLNVPVTLRLLLTVVAPPYTVSPFDNTDAPMTFRSFDRLTTLLNDANPLT